MSPALLGVIIIGPLAFCIGLARGYELACARFREPTYRADLGPRLRRSLERQS